MEMSREEIVRRYKEAKYKKGYIQILADLNGVDKSEIRKILIDAGITLPGNPNFGTPMAKIKKTIKKDKGMEPVKETKNVIEETVRKISEPKKPEIPDEIKEILEDDLNEIRKQIDLLVEKRTAIIRFLGKEI